MSDVVCARDGLPLARAILSHNPESAVIGRFDINLLPILFYLRNFPEAGGAIGAAKALSSYYERMAERPSFQNTIPPPPAQQAKAS